MEKIDLTLDEMKLVSAAYNGKEIGIEVKLSGGKEDDGWEGSSLLVCYEIELFEDGIECSVKQGTTNTYQRLNYNSIKKVTSDSEEVNVPAFVLRAFSAMRKKQKVSLYAFINKLQKTEEGSEAYFLFRGELFVSVIEKGEVAFDGHDGHTSFSFVEGAGMDLDLELVEETVEKN